MPSALDKVSQCANGLQMALDRYMHKRQGTSNWQLRWPLPPEARRATGVKEWTKNLKTSDKRAAERLAIPILAEWLRKASDIGDGIQSTSKAKPDFVQLAYEKYYLGPVHTFEERRLKGGLDGFDASRTSMILKSAQANRIFLAGDHSHMIKPMQKMYRLHGWVFDETDADDQSILAQSAEFVRAA